MAKKSNLPVSMTDTIALLLDGMLEELTNNSHFSLTSIQTNRNLSLCSKQMISTLIEAIRSEHIYAISSPEFKQLLKLWHYLLKEHLKLGFSTKETAFLIFALRASVLKQLNNNKHHIHLIDYSLFGEILDFLGLLTFEIFSTEKDLMLIQQSSQIKYLQKNQSQFKNDIIGNSPHMKSTFQMIGLVLENNISVLLQGETGTGKDLIATIIHKYSSRKNHPFIAVNCAAIPADLFESELFGHEKGAFTHAEEQRLGKFELANHGTLFLDELGDIPLDLQSKLLRAIQSREIYRLGGQKPIPIDIRIISATNQPLNELIRQKKFREDLYYRLSPFPISVPPLRNRPDDILPLALHFLKKYSDLFKIKMPPITQDAEHYLLQQQWAGNVRELENLMQRVLILSQGQPITATFLSLNPEDIFSDTQLSITGSTLLEKPYRPEPLWLVEKNTIIQSLKFHHGNIKKTAEQLEISRTTLYNKMKALEIDPSCF